MYPCEIRGNLDALVQRVNDLENGESEQADLISKMAEQRLRRLVQVTIDGYYPAEEYRRQKNQQEEKLRPLIVPYADVLVTAGKLVEDLSSLWDKSDRTERRRILLTMLDAVYVDTIDEKRVVAIRSRSTFRPFLRLPRPASAVAWF